MEKLNVGRNLSPYETQPWFFYHEESGITCSAEVRVGSDGTDLEAEIQFVYDEDGPALEEKLRLEKELAEEAKKRARERSSTKYYTDEDDDEGEGKGKNGSSSSKGPQSSLFKIGDNYLEQIMIMRMREVAEKKWGAQALFVKKEDYENKIPDWEEKGCDFFSACVNSIQIGELPDIDLLIKKELKDGNLGDQRGKIGRKSPKIKPENVMGMKKGGF